MPRFGRKSNSNLNTADPKLIRLMDEAIKYVDFGVVCGVRSEKEQNKAFAEGKSKVQYPNSKHNLVPSLAVDIVPWDGKKYCWGNDDKELLQIGQMIGVVKACAIYLGIEIRCGFDWDNDGNITDESFIDAFHVELV